MRIAILGLGTIGSGVVSVIDRCAVPITVAKILDRPERMHESLRMVCDMHDILDDPSIDLVVETIGGLHPAYEYITSAMQHGKHVVSANKAVIAAYLPHLLTSAKQSGVQFRFEASTGGGIPWLSTLQAVRRIESVQAVSGIFNGTTNFILDQMTHHDQTWHNALALAQQAGYAEADPSSDIDGHDIANKIVISAALAFDAYLQRDTIPMLSLSAIRVSDIHYAACQQMSVKYIGEAIRREHTYEASVMPWLIPSSSVEAQTAGNFNVASLHAATIGTLKFYGQGAGKLPTANAVVQDILDIVGGVPGYPLTLTTQLRPCFDQRKHRYLIRTDQPLSRSFPVRDRNRFENVFYHHTVPLTLQDIMRLYAPLQKEAPDAWVARLADQEDI